MNSYCFITQYNILSNATTIREVTEEITKLE